MSPFAVKHPISVQKYEHLIWDVLEERLQARGYPDKYIAATKVAFDVSAEIQRNERRKFKVPGWGRKYEPYIGHESRMLYIALGSAYQYQHPYILTSAILNHDDPETLVQQGYNNPADGIKYVLGKLDEGLRAQSLSEFTRGLDRTGQILLALYRNQNEDYYETGRKIARLPSIEDALLAFEAKGLDRDDNSADLLTLVNPLGFGNWDQIADDFGKLVHSLRSVFKTITIMNDQKVYCLFKGNIAGTDLLANSALTMKNVAVDTQSVLDKTTNTIQNFTYNRSIISEEEGRDMRTKILESILERERYYEHGGFELVTRKSKNHPYSGTVHDYNKMINNREARLAYSNDPVDINRDALAFKLLIHLLVREDKPDFYIKGMGLAGNWRRNKTLVTYK